MPPLCFRQIEWWWVVGAGCWVLGGGCWAVGGRCSVVRGGCWVVVVCGGAGVFAARQQSAERRAGHEIHPRRGGRSPAQKLRGARDPTFPSPRVEWSRAAVGFRGKPGTLLSRTKDPCRRPPERGGLHKSPKIENFTWKKGLSLTRRKRPEIFRVCLPRPPTGSRGRAGVPRPEKRRRKTIFAEVQACDVVSPSRRKLSASCGSGGAQTTNSSRAAAGNRSGPRSIVRRSRRRRPPGPGPRSPLASRPG